MMVFRLLLMGVAVLCWLAAVPHRGAAAEEHGFVKRAYKGKGGKEYKYELFIPYSYTADKPVPLILFLHGAGERVGGEMMPVEQGIGTAIKKDERSFPFLVIFPQAERTWSANSPDAERALAIQDDVMKTYKVDPKRIYLTGLSMGGMGTWGLALKYPDRWAAIVPICGRGNTTQAAKIKDVPCWCFHGDADERVSVNGSRRMIEALKAAGGNPKYTEYPGVGHNSWDRAYGTKELYDWLLMQHLK
jgi:predicted peptidase